jgi:dipeptidyl aminopeptidase/acylaminoacyl peptidase
MKENPNDFHHDVHFKQLSSLNDEKMSMIEPRPSYTNLYYTGSKGEDVQGWYLPPVSVGEDGNSSNNKKYPLVVIIHGGPQCAVSDSFHFRWNPAMFSSRDYGVFVPNFHGSPGFGQAFTDSINGNWGSWPFEDIMIGMDHILATYDYLDADRCGALGASYGGYMISWCNGHTDRFKCLVNHDGVFNLEAEFFNTEELWFPEVEFGGTPWEVKQRLKLEKEEKGDDANSVNLYELYSPHTYAHQMNTPTLVIQGGTDYRVCETESIGLFTTLQRRGVPSRFLFFPDENHWCLKPKNSEKWHYEIFRWLSSYLDEEGN